MRVLHVINGLQVGGTERTLLRLVAARSVDEAVVFSLTGDGDLSRALRGMGARVVSSPAGRWEGFHRAVGHVIREIDRARPALVHSWLVHSNLIGGIAARVRGRPSIWSLRHGALGRQDAKLRTRALIRAGAPLSRWLPTRIVACSERVARDHIRLGYCRSKIVVVPNGFDRQPEPRRAEARRCLRQSIGVSTDAPVIGHVGRFHPMKDHATFLRAVRMLLDRRSDVQIVMAGRGIDRTNAALMEIVHRHRLVAHVHLLGQVDDPMWLLSGLDVYTQSSTSEGFPNALAEAMLAGVPCVATTVGETEEMLGREFLLPVGDAEAMARRWSDLLAIPDAERHTLGVQGRQQILERFSLERTLVAYARVYEAVAAGAA